MRARRQPAAVRQPDVVDVGDDAMFVGVGSRITRVATGLNGRVRDYEMLSDGDVEDVGAWLRDESGLVRQVYDAMGEFVVKGRLVLKAWFCKVSPATGEVLRRELF
jgi:hypothetical protein